MGAQRNILPALAPRQPRGDTTRTVARELRLASVGIEQTQEQIATRLPLKELNAVGPDTGVSRTELPRKFSVTAQRQWLFVDEKIIAAGMRFDEGNHIASIVP